MKLFANIKQSVSFRILLVLSLTLNSFFINISAAHAGTPAFALTIADTVINQTSTDLDVSGSVSVDGGHTLETARYQVLPSATPCPASGGYSDFTAADGAFDEASEAITPILIDVSTFSDGAHHLCLRSRDSNSDIGLDELPFTLDSTDPVVNVTQPANASTVAGSVPVHADISDLNLTEYRVIIDDALSTEVFNSGWQPVPAPSPLVDQFLLNWDSTTVADGSYTVRVRGRDGALNTANDTNTITVANPPATPANLHPEQGLTSFSCDVGVTNNRIVTWDWDDNSESDLADYQVETSWAGTVTSLDSEEEFTVPDLDGFYSVRVRARDAASNFSSWTALCGITLDRSQPVTSDSASVPVADGSIHNGPIPLSGTTTDDNGVDFVNIYARPSSTGPAGAYSLVKTHDNASNGTPFVWSTTWDPATEGPFTAAPGNTYDIKVSGVDLAGNEETSAFAFNVLFDNTDPAVAITNPGNGDFVSGTVQIRADMSDTNLSDYRVGVRHIGTGTLVFTQSVTPVPGNPLVDTALASWDTTLVAGGAYRIQVQGRDTAGNVGLHTVDVTVDNVDPTLSLALTDDKLASGETSLQITGTINDDASPLNGAQFRIFTSGGTPLTPWTFLPADDGSYDSSSEAIDHTIDVSTLSHGEYELRVRARDEAFNVTSPFGVYPFIIDHTVPQSTLVLSSQYWNNPVQMSSLSNDTDAVGSDEVASVEFQYATISPFGPFTTIGAGVNTGPGSWGLPSPFWTPPSEGTFYLRVIATDEAGNSETFTLVILPFPPFFTFSNLGTVVYDVTPPVVNAGPDAVTGAVFTQNATASDALSGIASYSWTKTSGPGVVTFGTPGAEDTTVSANANGTYVLRLTVTDLAGNVAFDEFTLLWTGSPVGGPTDTTGAGGGSGIGGEFVAFSSVSSFFGSDVFAAPGAGQGEQTPPAVTTPGSPDTTAQKPEEVLAEETLDEGFNWWWLLFFLAIILLAYVLLRRRNTDDTLSI